MTKVRTVGTAGLNRLWEQVRDDDWAIALPPYGGAMTPGRWRRLGALASPASPKGDQGLPRRTR